MSRQVGRILSKTYTFITKGCFSPLRNGKRSQYTCKVDNIRWINIIRGGPLRKSGSWNGEKGWLERRGEEGFARGFAEEEEFTGCFHDPSSPSQGFPLNEERLVLVTTLRKHRSWEGKGRKRCFFWSEEFRAVGRISTWYNAMPWRTSLPPCLPVSNLSNEWNAWRY